MMITGRYYLSLTVVAASMLALASLTCGCPQATGWYHSKLTNKCYRGLFPEQRLNFASAQKRCNALRSNLFQFNPGDSKKVFDDLQDELYYYGNTTEFKEMSWIGLTDRGKVEEYVYLNNFPLASIAPLTYIVCPDSQPNCKPANRCVYLNLNNRGTVKRQIYSGNCETTLLSAICYAPVGGTDQFDNVPVLSAMANAVSLAALTASGFVFAVVKSLMV